MKFFKKYIFPALYGLLVYFTIRLLHDTDIRLKFWTRSWKQNVPEFVLSIAVGYVGVYMFERLFKYYNRRWPLQFSYQNLVRELAIMVGANLVLMNLVFTPWVIYLNGQLYWDDLADICMIPALYAVVYYGIARARTYGVEETGSVRAFIDLMVTIHPEFERSPELEGVLEVLLDEELSGEAKMEIVSVQMRDAFADQ